MLIVTSALIRCFNELVFHAFSRPSPKTLKSIPATFVALFVIFLELLVYWRHSQENTVKQSDIIVYAQNLLVFCYCFYIKICSRMVAHKKPFIVFGNHFYLTI